MKSDIQISQEAELRRIRDVAENYGIQEDELELYGKYKAKLSRELWDRVKDRPNGKLVLVTAINPTPAGEGKTTTSVGLCDALNLLGKKAVVARAESRALLRSQGRRRRRRICPGYPDGGSEPALHR